MNEIKRVPQSISGVPDGVELMTKCAVCLFEMDDDGRNIGIDSHEVADCRVLCSETNHALSISVLGKGIMFSLYPDDILKVILESMKAHNEIPPQRNLS